MPTSSAEGPNDGLILFARILLVLLFVVFGWGKLTHYQATVGLLAGDGLPVPPVTTIGVIGMEFFLSIVVILGFWTRPLALLFALYTLGTALIGHHFWTLEGPARAANAINFYKNLSIIAGFLLLYVTGPGKYSLDAKLGGRTTT